MINLEIANKAREAHAHGEKITPAMVFNLIAGVRGATFAQIEYVTEIKTAARHRDTRVQKVTCANIQMFNNLREFTDVYARAVQRSSGLDTFESSGNYFEHTDCYSIVRHKTDPARFYLFAIFNRADSLIFVNGEPATREHAAQYLTASEAKKLIEPSREVYNATHDITHNVTVRTIGMDNIVAIRACGDTLAV